MIFSELYSAYYNAVAKIISAIQNGEKDEKKLLKQVEKYAFGESFLTILPSLKSQKWQLVDSDMSTPIENPPQMPLTDIQKMWLKAISLDPRIKLFGVEFEGLEDVSPLFTPSDYYIYDKYGDGDLFEDEAYIKKFRFFLDAIRDKAVVKISLKNRRGNETYTKVLPIRMEYSEKDDKFRIITSGCRYVSVANLSRITKYGRYYGEFSKSPKQKTKEYKTLVMEINDYRNTCERCMLHFAHFEKQVEKIGDKQYILRIKYDIDDESEMAIRILSFGPTVKVLEPESLIWIIKDKLKKQKLCGLK